MVNLFDSLGVGEGQTYTRAVGFLILCKNAAAVAFHDCTANGQTHAEPVWFRRKECLKQFIFLSRWKSRTIVQNGDLQCIVEVATADGD